MTDKIEKCGTHLQGMKKLADAAKNRKITENEDDVIDYECDIGQAKYKAKFWAHVADCYECMNHYQAILQHAGGYIHTESDRRKAILWSKKWNE